MKELFGFLISIIKNNLLFSRVKVPKIVDRKWHCIDLILCHLRSSIYRQLASSANGKLLIIFGIIPLFLFAGTDRGSILLYNDSPFILTAIIQASDGTYLGQLTVQPNEQKNFTTHLAPTQYTHPERPDVSLTPYVVIWQCPSEGFYSMCTRVSPGAMVRANDCPGLQFCSPKQESQKPASTLKRKSQ